MLLYKETRFCLLNSCSKLIANGNWFVNGHCNAALLRAERCRFFFFEIWTVQTCSGNAKQTLVAGLIKGKFSVGHCSMFFCCCWTSLNHVFSVQSPWSSSKYSDLKSVYWQIQNWVVFDNKNQHWTVSNSILNEDGSCSVWRFFFLTTVYEELRILDVPLVISRPLTQPCSRGRGPLAL